MICLLPHAEENKIKFFSAIGKDSQGKIILNSENLINNPHLELNFFSGNDTVHNIKTGSCVVISGTLVSCILTSIDTNPIPYVMLKQEAEIVLSLPVGVALATFQSVGLREEIF